MLTYLLGVKHIWRACISKVRLIIMTTECHSLSIIIPFSRISVGAFQDVPDDGPKLHCPRHRTM